MLELPSSAADAGRGSLLDAEQLRLEQRFDERRAIDGDERPVAARAQFVDLPGDEFLAHAGLAFQQNGEIGDRDALDARTQCLHRGRRSDKRRGAVGPRLRSGELGPA